MSEAPEISVVVATRDRADRLAGLLRSLAEQTLGRAQFEVVVVDDGSGEGVVESVADAARESGLDVRTLPGAGRGPAAARNVGWRAARAPLIAFTDDDCEAAPDWLERVALEAAEHPGEIIRGPTTPIPRELARTGPFTRTRNITTPGPSYETCNIVYPHSVLERLGGFDEGFPEPLGEDTDLGWRARKAGVGEHWSEDVRVHHAVDDLGPGGYLRTALVGPDAVLAFRRHPELRDELRLGVFRYGPVLWLALALCATPFARRQPPAAIALTLPYARHLARTCVRRRAPILLAPYYALWDLLYAYTALRGSLRHRTLVL
jgi:glycosyltransferase involved in cell wall biosynthesis